MELEEHKDIVRNVFVSLLVLFVIFVFLKGENSFIFPGLEEKFFWSIIGLGVLTGILYMPFEDVWDWLESKFGRRKYGRKYKKGFLENIEERISRVWKIKKKKKPKKKYSYREEDKKRSWINYIFQGLLVFYLVLLLTETIKERLIPEWMNLNYLMGLVIFFGVITILFPPPEEKPWKRKKEEIAKKDYAMIVTMGAIGSLIVWYKTKEIGWISYLISFISGILIILLSILILGEDEE